MAWLVTLFCVVIRIIFVFQGKVIHSSCLRAPGPRVCVHSGKWIRFCVIELRYDFVIASAQDWQIDIANAERHFTRYVRLLLDKEDSIKFSGKSSTSS